MEQEPEHPLICLWQNAVVNNINARQKKAVLTFAGGKIIYVGKKKKSIKNSQEDFSKEVGITTKQNLLGGFCELITLYFCLSPTLYPRNMFIESNRNN